LGVLDEPVEQGGPVGLPVVAGVVALADQDGQELGAGAEVGAGLAGRFRAAAGFGGAGAQPVAGHPGAGFAAEPGHARGLAAGGQGGRLPVESAGLGADSGVLVGDDPVGDALWRTRVSRLSECLVRWSLASLRGDGQAVAEGGAALMRKENGAWKVVDLSVREWGAAVDGFALSIRQSPTVDPEAQAAISAVLRNVSEMPIRMTVPGGLFFYHLEITGPDGTSMPMSPFGRELLKPARNTERVEIQLAPGEVKETEIPVGSLFTLRKKGSCRAQAWCELPTGAILRSNEIVI